MLLSNLKTSAYSKLVMLHVLDLKAETGEIDLQQIFTYIFALTVLKFPLKRVYVLIKLTIHLVLIKTDFKKFLKVFTCN